MEELLTKYRVNLNAYSGNYDLVVFMCKVCAEELKLHNPYTYKHGGFIPLSKIKVIEVDAEDCLNHSNTLYRKRGSVIPLYTEGITNTFTVTIEETVAQDFEITATDYKTALEIAKERYNNGDIVLAPGEAQTARMAIIQSDRKIATDWVDI